MINLYSDAQIEVAEAVIVAEAMGDMVKAGIR